MKKILIRVGTGFLNAAYSIMKRRPVKNRIVFISRQSNKPSRDIQRLEAYFKAQGMETEVLCKMMGGSLASYAAYIPHMFTQMKYMATSRMVVLDTYCIAACLLKHREELLIAQMWHALGSLKKFSLSILDMAGGRDSETANIMHMHEQYDIIFTSSEASRPAFAEAFGYEEEDLTVMSLPRVDVLLDQKCDKINIEKIKKAYPQAGSGGRKVILYAPTFRKGGDISQQVGQLVDAVDFSKYDLIIKLHPLDNAPVRTDKAIVDKKFSTMDMLSFCDIVITDYSAVTYEAALKEKPLLFYAFDIDDYVEGRDFYIDYREEIPGPVRTDASEIMELIEEGGWDLDKVRKFADKYIEKREHCTEEMGEFLLDRIRQQTGRTI